MFNLLIILPLLIAALATEFLKGRNRKYIGYIALAASIVSLLLIFAASSNASTTQTTNWFSFAGYQFTLVTSTMPLNMLLLGILGVITPLIILYSIGFMDVPSEQPRYYAELCIFAAAMMLFAMAGSFLVMFIGWELLGVTSYLLIGFWYQREGTPQAARKAITTILLGDVLMLIAMLVIWNAFHTFTFATIIAQAGTQTTGSVGLALVLLMFAVFTKSAQFPFHEWLPDAMKGPTPVSAFLHSSTMVKAGVFLVAVLLPLFIAYHLLYLLMVFGFITAILGITNALAENHIKRILAYSTIEDLGLMFIALGTGSLIAAMMLFLVQTFYKALLFMSAGSIIKANDNEEDITRLYNDPTSLKLFIPTLLGVASLAGLFPLSGFFGKAAVASSISNIGVYALFVVLELASTLYIFRWLFVPMKKKSASTNSVAKTNYRTMPIEMLIPILILAILVIVASYSYIYLPSYLSQKSTISQTEIIISVAIFVIGLAATYFLFSKNKYSVVDEGQPAYKYLYNNLFVNRFYISVASAFAFAAQIVDEFDYSFYNAIKRSMQGAFDLSNQIKKVENGNANTYIALFVIGLIVILLLFIVI